ncbi:conserved hypothetical protein [Theileria equi strain WA]|uniref:ELMO domain-containing protein n=1 Tax=Theileria equi strain WA TaxID=1537102 RepID=L1LE60_THEEQ|nr:conserved hypothetical protein [Theileria equi strain WA]EKX73569.1 conserved hypothetical protein [Theileria equi strain WA]|eukprot:XP_004833021.1 conserved hypothetical protein [Theileria equi strain WA]
MCSMITDILDYIIALITGYSRGQRVLLDRSLVDLLGSLWWTLGPVSYKIHDPKVIANFEQLCLDTLDREVFANLHNNPKLLDSVTKMVMERLNIDEKYLHLVEDAVLQISKHLYHLAVFDKTISVQVDEETEAHRKLLDELWTSLETRPLPESYSVSHSVDATDKTTSSWGVLGFQMPLTDFRRTGLLGLQCLNYMATNFPEKSKEALEASNDAKLWFPFAVTSINVTSWVLDYWNTSKLGAFSYNNDRPPLETFYIIHSFVFFEFINFWRLSDAKSILEFKEVSLKLL